MMNAHETETSPTRRGKYVRERVLCHDRAAAARRREHGDPRPRRRRGEDAAREARAAPRGPDLRGLPRLHRPAGVLVRGFDEIGAFRTENRAGYTLDVSGDLDGVPLASARELATMLVDDVRVGRCMITQLHRHSSGRLEATTEVPALRALESEFESSGYRFRELLLAFVTSDLFRTVAAPEVE
jgi:hypothetical protein